MAFRKHVIIKERLETTKLCCFLFVCLLCFFGVRITGGRLTSNDNKWYIYRIDAPPRSKTCRTGMGTCQQKRCQNDILMMWWDLVKAAPTIYKRCNYKYIPPGRLTWNIIIGVWKIIFLSKWVICRFQPLIFQAVPLQGAGIFDLGKRNKIIFKISVFFGGGIWDMFFPWRVVAIFPFKYFISTPRLVSEILLVHKLLGNHDIDIDDVRHLMSKLAQTIQQSIESFQDVIVCHVLFNLAKKPSLDFMAIYIYIDPWDHM